VNKKESIKKAALTLLVAKGIHDTPMSAIAEKAKTGMGTIYNYYPTKISLINALYVEIKLEEQDIFDDFDRNKPIRTQFEGYYFKAIQFYLDNPMYFNFMEQLIASPIISKESRNHGFNAIKSMQELIEKGIKDRVIKNMGVNELIYFIGGTTISYLRFHFQKERVEQPTLHNQMKMVWDAIKE